jgi:hypothetical protein
VELGGASDPFEEYTAVVEQAALARAETYWGVGPAVASVIVSAAPPPTHNLQLVNVVASVVLGFGFVWAKILNDNAVRAKSADRDDWFRRQIDALRRSSVGADRSRSPRVRLEYVWEQGEPRDKPITIRNAGGGEARRVAILPVATGPCKATFRAIPLLSDTTIDVRPEFDCEVGPFWQPQNLLDFLKLVVSAEERRIREEGQAGRRPNSSLAQDIDFLVRAAMKARVRSRVELFVSYEDERGTKLSTRYELDFEMFAEIEWASLNWIADE